LRDARARDLQTLVGKELDGLNKATTFFYYPLLYDFAEAGSRPTVVAARGNEVYVLDSGLHRLYKFLLNETRDQLQPAPTRMPTPAPTPNPVVMRQGDERGAIVVGEMADIFWGTAGAGRTSTGLLTLTAQKQVVEYVPSRGINVLAIAAAPGWEEATLGESFNGNLYVLDAKANRILKFAPTGEDFKTPPIDYVSPGVRVDFGGATGMAVDGFVWVLLADGTIMKFDGGNPVAFDKRGIDTPLKKTVAIVAQQNSPSLWVADAGNRRIVQFNKTGEYVRQYKPDDPRVMSDLRGFAVDETAQRFYWLNGTRLYLGTLQN
jgi:DNA-binding beta-propeller fold protein YncE